MGKDAALVWPSWARVLEFEDVMKAFRVVLMIQEA